MTTVCPLKRNTVQLNSLVYCITPLTEHDSNNSHFPNTANDSWLVNWILLDFGLLVGQKRILVDVTLATSVEIIDIFHTFLTRYGKND